MKKSLGSLLGFVVLCLFVEILGGWFANQSVKTWYPALAKPYGTPPGWVFGPVWTILYMLMAVAAWLIWSTPKKNKFALGLWGVQLALNLIWSYLFFTLRNPFPAMLDILLLWVVILGTMVSFWRINSLAGMLMLPYLIWVSYAAYLNIFIWYLN
jgi:benzodiazapine receptor